MKKERAIEILKELKKECNNHSSCLSCPFYYEGLESNCIFCTPDDIAKICINDLPNLLKTFQVTTTCEFDGTIEALSKEEASNMFEEKLEEEFGTKLDDNCTIFRTKVREIYKKGEKNE